MAEIERLRQQALHNYRQQQEASRDLARMKREHIARHGAGPDSEFVFKSRAVVKDAISDEQLYCRWTMLRSNVAIMEMLYKLCKQLDVEVGS